MHSNGQDRVADAVPQSWVDIHAPPSLRPYLRLARADRPIGYWLLALPCLWSAALAAINGAALGPMAWHMLLFCIGAIVMRGAGCTWNDLVDHDIDARVERTRSRPLPSGQVSRHKARLFLVAQLLVGLFVLLQFNTYAVAVGLSSFGVIAAYPFMKRFTHWPQSVLGLAFSWGALMGWAAAFGRLDWAPVLLYAGANLWVIGYDTIYAHQDSADDAIVGVKSTALLFGEKTPAIVAALYGGAALFIALAIHKAGGGMPSYLGLALFLAHGLWQVRRLNIHNPDLCRMLFSSNREAGLMLLAGLLADALARATV